MDLLKRKNSVQQLFSPAIHPALTKAPFNPNPNPNLFEQAWLLGKEVGGAQTRHPGFPPRGSTGTYRRGAPIPPGISPRRPRTFRLRSEGLDARHKGGRGPDSTPRYPPGHSRGTYRRGPPDPPTPRGLPLGDCELFEQAWVLGKELGGAQTRHPGFPPRGSTGTYRRGAPIPPGIPPRRLRTLRAGLVARQGGGRGPNSTSWVSPTGLYRDLPEGCPHPPGDFPQAT